MKKQFTLLLSAAVLAPLGSVMADTIAVQSGPDLDFWTLNSQSTDNEQTLAASWTSSQSFTNVTIGVTLDGDFGSGSTVQAYLTDNIGTGTTAADVLDSSSFVYSSGPTDESFTAFSGLSLGPGTYYLVLFNTGASGVWWGSDVSATQATAPGVTINSDQFSNVGVNNTSPWESEFSAFDLGLHYSVTGTASSSAVPEPASVGLLLAGLAAMGAGARLRRKRRG